MGWEGASIRLHKSSLIGTGCGRNIYINSVQGNVAEAGVNQGEFAKYINQAFPDRKLYLYDTFEGFDQADKEIEFEKEFTSDAFFVKSKDFRHKCAEQNMNTVRVKMKHIENCRFRKGYFPESADRECKEKFAFVSIDMDLYKPVLAALHFFFPRLSEGGYIFLHDYNHVEFTGIKVAVSEFEKVNGKIIKVPLSDQGGTLVITKNDST